MSSWKARVACSGKRYACMARATAWARAGISPGRKHTPGTVQLRPAGLVMTVGRCTWAAVREGAPVSAADVTAAAANAHGNSNRRQIQCRLWRGVGARTMAATTVTTVAGRERWWRRQGETAEQGKPCVSNGQV